KNGSEQGEYTFIHRVRKILIEPSDAVDSDVIRVKARLLSFALLLIVIILPAVQIVLGILFENVTIFVLATSIFFIVYVVSRTKFVAIAGIIITLTLAIMPYLFLLVEFNQTPMKLGLNLIIWPVIAALFGSQWLTSRFELLLISGETMGLLIFCNLHTAIGLTRALEPIIDQAALSLAVLIFTWSLNYYVALLEEHKQFLEQRQRELEVYTSVLTHDLGNDMQIVKGHIELISETMDISPKMESYLSTALAVSERMASVIKLFSVVGRGNEYDFLETLKTMADQSKHVRGGANVSLMFESDYRSADIRPGILLPLVLENLLRNTVDYAGEGAIVTIRIGLVQKMLLITYRDSGPGIDEKIRPRIFQKGVTSKGEGKGLGLYLSKRIVESYGGKIELLDTKTGTGAAFLISVPIL
ncbi:MAG: HAMP domain-containing histidine kinase, partial [Candidatus Thorarchaeota archaeon]|nr:HAMP domain-containing histidine kinase [Candidatus Thorarchaeota archaeon]